MTISSGISVASRAVLPGVEQRASALNLCLADRRVPMQIHVQLRETLAFDLTAAQQRQQGVMDPYPNRSCSSRWVAPASIS